MMNSKGMIRKTWITLVALTVVAILAVPVYGASVYYVPDPSHDVTGGTEWVILYADLDPDETMLTWQATILIDADHADITLMAPECNPYTGDTCFQTVTGNLDCTHSGNRAWVWGYQPRYWDDGDQMWKTPESGAFDGANWSTVRLGKIRVLANNTPGVSPLNFMFDLFPPECFCCQPSMLNNLEGDLLTVTWINSTFGHEGIPEPFEKELALGWNLISLPLTPVNNSTSSVLGNNTIAYDAVFRYDADATAKQFVDVITGTMDPGIGYFVNVTTAGNWSYTGIPYTSMTIDLKQGLNCIGWVNASADLPAAMSSISGNYRYVAGWDADDSKYGVYDANAPAGVPEFIDFVTMGRGNGYWIAAKEDCTLTVS